MKKAALAILISMASTAFAQDSNADFTGFYAGLQVGSNRSKASGTNSVSKTTTYPGYVAGYAVNQYGLVIGGEVFVDDHNDSTTYQDAGVGLKVGKVFSDVLVFGRLGATGSWPSWRPQFGVGAETKVSKNISVTALYSTDRSTDSGITRENNSFSVGVNYYFK